MRVESTALGSAILPTSPAKMWQLSLLLLFADVSQAVAGMPLPDVVGAVTFSHFGMLEPPSFLPTCAELDAMSSEELEERFRYFVTAFLLTFIVFVGLGTLVMMMPAWCRISYSPITEDGGSGEVVEYSPSLVRTMVAATFTANFIVDLVVAVWSLNTDRVSRTTGLAFEIWYALYVFNGMFLLVQAVYAVQYLPKGRVFGMTTFAEAAIAALMPVLSDAYDTLKDVLFGALCFASTSLHWLGYVSLGYVAFIHCIMLCFNSLTMELAGSYLPALLAESSSDPSTGNGLTKWEKFMGVVYKQTTFYKRSLLFLENLPQAIFAIIYLRYEGGSPLVATLNIGLPVAHFIWAWFCNKLLKTRLSQWFGNKLDIAMATGNVANERRFREELDFLNDPEMLREIVPHCKALVQYWPQLNNVRDYNDKELLTLVEIWDAITYEREDLFLNYKPVKDVGLLVKLLEETHTLKSISLATRGSLTVM